MVSDSSTSSEQSMDKNERRLYKMSAKTRKFPPHFHHSSVARDRGPAASSSSHPGSTAKISTPPPQTKHKKPSPNKSNNDISNPSKPSSSVKRFRETEEKEVGNISSKQNKVAKMEEKEKIIRSENKRQKTSVAEAQNSAEESEPIWSPKDEVKLLKGLVACSVRGKVFPNNMAFVYDHVKSLLDGHHSNEEMHNKLKHLRLKFNDVNEKVKDKGFGFMSRHEETAYELSKQVWGKVEEEQELTKKEKKEEEKKRKSVVDEEEEEDDVDDDDDDDDEKDEEEEVEEEDDEGEAILKQNFANHHSCKGLPKTSNTDGKDVEMTQKDEDVEGEGGEEDEREFIHDLVSAQKITSADVEMTQKDEDSDEDESETDVKVKSVQHIADNVMKQSNAVPNDVVRSVRYDSGRDASDTEESEEEEEEEDGSESDTQEINAPHISNGIRSNGNVSNGNLNNGSRPPGSDSKKFVKLFCEEITIILNDFKHELRNQLKELTIKMVREVREAMQGFSNKRTYDEFQFSCCEEITRLSFARRLPTLSGSFSNNRKYEFSCSEEIERLSFARGLPELSDTEAKEFEQKWQDQQVVEAEAKIKCLSLLQEEFQMRMEKLRK